MKYKKMILLICITLTLMFTVSGVFANNVTENISTNYLDSEVLQIDADTDNLTDGDALSTSVVYFDASADNDGDGSKSNPYKYYKSDRINYGTTAYFADGIYNISDANSIYSSLNHKTTFIGQSKNTVLLSLLSNKFDFTVTENSYFVLKNMTLEGVHINNQANLIADNVYFAYKGGFNPNYPPSLSYTQSSKIYDGSFGGVIICDTPSDKITALNLTDCFFLNNSASSGGVIAAYNTIANIDNCMFYNSTASRFGGVIYSIKSTFNIKKSSFTMNYAKYAGAIYANSSQFNIKDSQFILSQSSSFGGVIASFSSNFDINNVIFKDYASLDDAGGAIYSIGGTLNITKSTFNNGSSDFGGAICALKSNSTIQDSQFINNDVSYYGGSIYVMYGNIKLNRNNFTNTHADTGGSIFDRLSDSLTLTNNRFVNSKADNGDIIFIDGGKVTVVENSNTYDSSLEFIKYGNVYDIEYHKAVPVINYSVDVPQSLPVSYDSRKYGYITPVKNQLQGGNCWAFAGIATLEACIKKATGIEYDFSEENVKNLMADYSLFDLNTGVNSGGNLYMFIAYLAGWFGPTYDVNDVYDDYSALSVIYDAVLHVQNVYILPERENFFDNNATKKAVMAYGAVSIGIDLSQNQGHAVTIVGWDDEYVSTDFLGNTAVGAWIIKNSWGSDWGYDGYGYLSYQQPFSFGYTFIFNDGREYANIYQYDFSGKKNLNKLDTSDVVYIKNNFTAKNDEILSAVSTYFDEPTNFTVKIYLNGKEVTKQDGSANKGYYTIPLVNEISMKKGDNFEVEIKIFNGAPVYIPISAADGVNKMNFNKGISFYSVDGVNWQDLYESSPKGILAIKAFTRMESLTSISINPDESGNGSTTFTNVSIGDVVNLNLNLPQYYSVDGVQYSLDGLVTFKVNNESYYATVENGKASLNISFEKEGSYVIEAQFKSNGVVSNVINFKVDVVKNSMPDLVIFAPDVSKFYGGSEKYVATFLNGNIPLTAKSVKIIVNGKEYIQTTDSNGQVVLDLNLPVGIYEVTAQYDGKRAVSDFAVLSTIYAEDTSNGFLEAYAVASFIDTEGKALTNTFIKFNVTMYGVVSKPVIFNATTDRFGLASKKINLPTGKYTVYVVNPINNEKKEFTVDILPIDSKSTISITQSGSYVTINSTISSPYATGYVNFIVSGKVYKVPVQSVEFDGIHFALASLKLNLDAGNYNVEAIYSGDDNVKVSSASREFSVIKNPYTLHSRLYYAHYYNANGRTIAQLTDSSGNPVKGEVVSATILNKTYYNTTDENGNALFMPVLPVGTYDVLFEYKGQSISNKWYIRSTMDMVNTTIEYLNSNIVAKFAYPYSGTPSSQMRVSFIIDGKEYNTTTYSIIGEQEGSSVTYYGYAMVNVDLPVGTHTITTINLCNKEVKESNITVYRTTPEITLTKTKRGGFTVFTATLSQKSAVGNLVFTIGSNKYSSVLRNGEAVLALNLEEGSHEIYANYIGDYNFNNIKSSTMKFNHVNTNYTITAPSISRYYGGAENFTVTLTDSNKPVSGAVIKVAIGNEVYDIKTDSNGVAVLKERFSPNKYNVYCTLEGDDDVFANSEMEIKSTISVTNRINNVANTKITAEFKDVQGNLLKNKKVSFKIGSKEYYETTNSNGIATFAPSLDKGNYTVAIINPVSTEIEYATLVIVKSTPEITLSFGKENGVDVLKAVLPKTATGVVNFEFDNGDIYTVDIVDGVASIECEDPGEYNVAVTYSGDDNFNQASNSIDIKVTWASVLSASKVTTTYGTSKKITVILKDVKGRILVGRTVTVNLNKKNYNAVVGSNGKAIISIPSNLAVKTYTAKITYAGETNIAGNSININVVVNKATPKLTASKKTFKVKDKSKKYTVTLKTDKKKVYKNQKITIKVKGKTYTAKTNSKGIATFKLTKLTKKGTFKATVKYVGNSYYKAVTKTVKITVK